MIVIADVSRRRKGRFDYIVLSHSEKKTQRSNRYKKTSDSEWISSNISPWVETSDKCLEKIITRCAPRRVLAHPWRCNTVTGALAEESDRPRHRVKVSCRSRRNKSTSKKSTHGSQRVMNDTVDSSREDFREIPCGWDHHVRGLIARTLLASFGQGRSGND